MDGALSLQNLVGATVITATTLSIDLVRVVIVVVSTARIELGTSLLDTVKLVLVLGFTPGGVESLAPYGSLPCGRDENNPSCGKYLMISGFKRIAEPHIMPRLTSTIVQTPRMASV